MYNALRGCVNVVSKQNRGVPCPPFEKEKEKKAKKAASGACEGDGRRREVGKRWGRGEIGEWRRGRMPLKHRRSRSPGRGKGDWGGLEANSSVVLVGSSRWTP